MLNSYIIAVYVIWLVSAVSKGFCLYSVMLLVPTTMFAVRKVGIHVKASKIAVFEGLFLFFSITWTALFSQVNILRLILTILCRLVFLIVCFYEDTVYVYIQEERKKV